MGLALSVVIFHAARRCYEAECHHGLFPLPFFPAVPLFLAISGFCVLGSIESCVSCGEFFARRAIRVMPAMLLYFAFILVSLGPAQLMDVVYAYLTIGFVGHSQLWSVGAEELLYFALAGMWVAGLYRRRAFLWTALIATAALCTFGPVKFELYLLLPPCFLIGNLAYVYRERVHRLDVRWSGPLGLVACLLWASALAAASGVAPHRIGTISIFALAAVTVILGMTVPARSLRKMDLSYGIYLFQGPFISPFPESSLLPPSVPRTWAVFLPLSIGLTVLMALASWLLVERHALKLKGRLREWVLSRKPPAIPELLQAPA